MTDKKDKELVDAAMNVMYLGARRVMGKPGTLNSKTVHICLEPEIIHEATRRFVSETRRLVMIGHSDSIEVGADKTGIVKILDKTVYVSELHSPRARVLLAEANIILVNPAVTWGTFQLMFDRVLRGMGREMKEWAVVRPFSIGQPIKPTGEDFGPLDPYYWEAPTP